MLRMTLLLCGGMFASLMILGEDKGQLRPGLALAASEGRLDEVWALARAKAERQDQPAIVLAAAAVEAPSVSAEAAPKAAPELTPVRAAASASRPVVVETPDRDVIAVLEEPVFTLSSVGNEPLPAAKPAPVVPETLPGGEGTIWYVNATSVNVRAEPSTEADILGKLGSGEAALMVASVDGEWARIVIQGDGLEGFVALRYLSPEAP